MAKKLRNLLYAVTTTGLLGIAGCGKAYKEPEVPRLSDSTYDERAKTEYTLEDFKRVLGDRVIPEREEELEKIWYDPNLNSGEGRGIFMNIYSNPKDFYNNLSIREKKEFDEFIPDNVKKSEIKEIQKKTPWKLEPKNGKFSESDKMLIYLIKSFEHLHL